MKPLREQKMPSDASVTIPKRGKLTPKRIVFYTGSLDYALGFNETKPDLVIIPQVHDDRALRSWERLCEYIPDNNIPKHHILKLDETLPSLGDFDFIPFKNDILIALAYGIGLKHFPEAEAIEVSYIEADGAFSPDKNPLYFSQLEEFMNKITGTVTHDKYSESSTFAMPPIFITNPIWHKPIWYWMNRISDGLGEDIFDFIRKVPWNCVHEVDSGKLCGQCHKCWELFYSFTSVFNLNILSWFEVTAFLIQTGEDYLKQGQFDVAAQQKVLELLRTGDIHKLEELK